VFNKQTYCSVKCTPTITWLAWFFSPCSWFL